MISKKKTNPQYMIIIIIGLLITLATALLILTPKSNKKIVTNFDECVAAGYPVMESYPEQCATPDGQTFKKTVIVPPVVVTIRGQLTCLPHKNSDGPQTLECAIGLESEDGTFYSLKEADPNNTSLFSQPMDKKLQINGTFVAQEDDKYKSVGVITVQNITKL